MKDRQRDKERQGESASTWLLSFDNVNLNRPLWSWTIVKRVSNNYFNFIRHRLENEYKICWQVIRKIFHHISGCQRIGCEYNLVVPLSSTSFVADWKTIECNGWWRWDSPRTNIYTNTIIAIVSPQDALERCIYSIILNVCHTSSNLLAHFSLSKHLCRLNPFCNISQTTIFISADYFLLNIDDFLLELVSHLDGYYNTHHVVFHNAP